MESSSAHSSQLQSNAPAEIQQNDSGQLPSVSSVSSIESTETHDPRHLPAIFTKTEVMKKPSDGGLKLQNLVVDIQSQTWVNEARNQTVLEPSAQMEPPEIQHMHRERGFEESVEAASRQAREGASNLCCDFTGQYAEITGECINELDKGNCNNYDPCFRWLGATIVCPVAISLTIVGAILATITEVSCAAVGAVKKECCDDR